MRAEAGCRTAFVSNVIPVGDVSLGRWIIEAISPGEAWQADINRAKELVYPRLAAKYRLASE